ncbi:MAG: hypothetical protein LBB45_08845 [Methanobrevibacter sp.]|jgi:hypothetical protein|nr:hypothetical protein [Candidatus Methanovirga basalitermitum]
MNISENFFYTKNSIESLNLKKKYPSLKDDFKHFQEAFIIQIKGNVPQPYYTPVPGLGKDYKCKTYIAKKFHCEKINR